MRQRSDRSAPVSGACIAQTAVSPWKDVLEIGIVTIARMWCKRMKVAFDEAGIQYLTRKLFDNPEILPRATHPRDIALMILDYSRYDGTEPALTPDYVDKACTVYFIVET